MGHRLIKMLTPTEYSYNQISQDCGYQPFWIYVVIINDIAFKIFKSRSELVSKTLCMHMHLSFFFLQASQDETMKQNEALINEIECLRGDLQKTRNDRDQQQSQLEAVKIEHVRYKECAEKSFTELEKSTLKSNELEVSVCHFPLVLVLI